MLKSERALYIAQELDRLFPDPPIPLQHSDPYTLLVAVVLSAQCTDVRVNQITPELFRRASTPAAMVELGVDEVRSVIKPCGLSPFKARAIVETSYLLLERHAGEVPRSLEQLEALPGVGHKTASVVMSQAFGVATFPVDTHIHRIAQMWKLTDGANVVRTERDLKAVFPEECWNRLHLQIIYYGREYCPARGCDGLRCDICKYCYPKRSKPLKAKRP